MRIVQLIDNLAPGGAERVVIMLSAGLAARGHQVTLVVSEGGGLLEAQVADAGFEYRVMEHSALFGVDGIVRLARMLSRERVDVLHCHLLGSDIVGRTAGLLTRVPVLVSTAHERTPRGRVYDGFRMLTSRLIGGTVACGADVEAYCRDQLHIPPEKLFRVDNGVDLESFVRARRDFEQVRTLAIVASHIPRKGHRYLFEALATLTPDYPDLRLHVVGTGPLGPQLREMVHALGLDEAVRFLGARSDVAEALAEVEAVILPSLDEGLPIAVLEAMAARKVVIASAVSAIPEVLDGGAAGVLVPPGDSEALAAAIASVLDDPEPMGLADAALARVERAYSMDAMVESYLRIYRDLGAS
ncbi:MAG: glycosyltransferase [Coriobacteriia bacterium]|nr:glycosyltransferase [Coriobacteriia bacterium]